jgi:hypothetical protein
MANNSRANGWLGAAAAATCFLVALFDGLDGNAAMAGLFGFFAVVLGLQALDDLVWHGSQDRVAVPLKRVFGALALGCLLWVLVTLLN